MLWFFLAMYLGSGLLLVAMSIPLVQRRVAPNQVYGFRVKRTLSDRRVWYEANAYSGRQMIGAGVALAAVAVVTALVMWLSGSVHEGVYVAICTAALLGGLLVALLRSFRFLGRIDADGGPA